MAWTVGDFKLELENIQMLMKVRKSPEMAQSLLNQLKTKLESHKWTATSLCEMMEACSACGLEDEHKEALLVVLEKTASSSVQADSNLKLASKPQSLIHIMNYMSAKDWDAMLAGNSWDCIILVAKRLRACGMVSLREDSKKWCTAFLVAVEMQKSGTAPPYDEIYRWSVSLHEAFVNLPNSNVPARNIYPEHPSKLGNDWILSVYGPDDAPAPKDMPGLAAQVQSHTPIRNTSSLLSWNQAKPGSKRKSNDKDMLDGLVNALVKKAMDASHNNSSSPALDFSSLKPKQPALPIHGNQVVANAGQSSSSSPDKAPAAGTNPEVLSEAMVAVGIEQGTPEQSSPETAKCSDKTSKTLADFEQEAFEALQKSKQKGTKQMKKPAAAAPKAKSNAKSAGKAASKKIIPSASSKKMVYGCIRCRGNTAGCSSCQNPNFLGLRLPGRSAWLAWHANHVKSKNSKSKK